MIGEEANRRARVERLRLAKHRLHALVEPKAIEDRFQTRPPRRRERGGISRLLRLVPGWGDQQPPRQRPRQADDVGVCVLSGTDRPVVENQPGRTEVRRLLGQLVSRVVVDPDLDHHRRIDDECFEQRRNRAEAGLPKQGVVRVNRLGHIGGARRAADGAVEEQDEVLAKRRSAGNELAQPPLSQLGDVALVGFCLRRAQRLVLFRRHPGRAQRAVGPYTADTIGWRGRRRLIGGGDQRVERRVDGLSADGAFGVGCRRECQTSEQMTTFVRPKVCCSTHPPQFWSLTTCVRDADDNTQAADTHLKSS